MKWCWLVALSAWLGACGQSVRHDSSATGGSGAPANPDVPAEGDGQLTGGSFEGGLGDGWDFCGVSCVSAPSQMPAGSDGASFLVFDTRTPCETRFESENDIQIELWPVEDLSAGEPLHLYFDIKNFEATEPLGVLAFGGVHRATDNPCKSDEVLARVPLADLALTSKWQTRCVSFTPMEAIVAFGPSVSGESCRIGLDALRFGPPCSE